MKWSATAGCSLDQLSSNRHRGISENATFLCKTGFIRFLPASFVQSLEGHTLNADDEPFRIRLGADQRPLQSDTPQDRAIPDAIRPSKCTGTSGGASRPGLRQTYLRNVDDLDKHLPTCFRASHRKPHAKVSTH